MDRFEPMLAATYVGRLTKFPAIVQPKFNGYRCLLSNRDCWTRDQNDHNHDLVWSMFNQIQDSIPNHWVLDGEIYCHGKPLQDIISLGKRWRLESTCLQLVVYDVYMEDRQGLGFEARMRQLKAWLELDGNAARIVVSPDNTVHSEEDVAEALEHWVNAGYEGVILRQPNSPYHFGRRGRDLQKEKKWVDAEWMIIDVTEGTGKAIGTPVYHFQSETGKPFKCCINRDYPELRRLWRNRKHAVGKRMTIKYNDLTKDKCPTPARGLIIRDYE